MPRPTRNPVALVREALEAGEEAFGQYSHPKSPRRFTQQQLFAMLVLKRCFRLDYRGTVQWIANSLALRRALGLDRVPNYSTLCYAERRLLPSGTLTNSLMRPFLFPDDPA